MSVYSAARRTFSDPQSSILQVLAALVGGVTLFILIAIALLIGFDAAFANQIYPGVSVGGVDLSGLATEEAAPLLSERLTYPQTGKIVFEDGDRLWAASPAELGLTMDANASAQAAFQLGRSGNPFSRLVARLAAWHSGSDLSPLMIYDERVAHQYISEIAAEIDQPTIEASLSVEGVEVIALPGQVGRQVGIRTTLDSLRTQLLTLTDGLLPLAIQETPPEILDASQAAQAARQILSGSITLQLPEDGESGQMPWVIPPEQLAGMLNIERKDPSEGEGYRVDLDDDALYTYINALAPDIDRQPANARFIFNDDTRLLEVIQPAVIGRSLDVYSSIQEIKQKVHEGQRTIPLKVVTIQPEIGDEVTGEQLGISELLVAETSYFRGSSQERLQNIQTAAANFHGLLVPPGATFSMASNMADVTLDNGYAEALIIFGGRTINGVGGGVCQVSTTLFRTVFFAGFPIVERHPHAYRVGYYEQNYNGHDENLAGLDATVFVPMVDFKFVNDSPYWLLMETYFNPTSRSLTWKFYSTSDGRNVEWETSGPQNIVDPPKTKYEENPELAKGEIDQVEWAAEGADVQITRTVYINGQALFTDSFITHYMPWGDVFQYGPGTKLPNQRNNDGNRRWNINP